MNTKTTIMIVTVFAVLGAPFANAAPLGSGWTYQGRLYLDNEPDNGTAGIQLRLWDAVTFGTLIGGVVQINNVSVTDGFFTVQPDFGASAFSGDARWLGISVRSPAGAGIFTTLVPRQPLTATPGAKISLERTSGYSGRLRDFEIEHCEISARNI